MFATANFCETGLQMKINNEFGVFAIYERQNPLFPTNQHSLKKIGHILEHAEDISIQVLELCQTQDEKSKLYKTEDEKYHWFTMWGSVSTDAVIKMTGLACAQADSETLQVKNGCCNATTCPLQRIYDNTLLVLSQLDTPAYEMMKNA